MEIRNIEDCLGDLLMEPLKCLTPDGQTYGAMLLQPDGPIEVSGSHIGHSDAARGETLCRSFLACSVAANAELVVTPEYCVPFRVVREIVAPGSQLLPHVGSIWVLGLESMPLATLDADIAALRGPGRFVHHEPLADRRGAAHSFVDPLLYVFWSKAPDGRRVLCLCLQFKTGPSRDELDLEQRHLCPGSIIYAFNRKLNQIGLLSIICSDAFNFTDDMVDQYHIAMLLIHIQMNPDPSHTDFRRYRTRLLSIGSDKDVELLCLNWAGNVTQRHADGRTLYWANSSGSAIYAPPPKFAAADQIVLESHRNGLYYSRVDYWHALYLHQEPHAVLLQKQKVMTSGRPRALAPCTCATVVHRWTWQSTNTILATAGAAQDGFADIVALYPHVAQQLLELALVSPLAVERALELLCGAAKDPQAWYEFRHMQCMKVNDDHETLRRATVNQDAAFKHNGIAFRQQRLQLAHDAADLPNREIHWPPQLSDLADGYMLSWDRSQPHANVKAVSSGKTASLVYLSDRTTPDAALTAFHFLQSALAQDAAVANAGKQQFADAVACSGDRICVVYRAGESYIVKSASDAAHINWPPGHGTPDIGGGPQW